MNDFDLRKYLAENRLLKEELTWFIDDENSDVRYKNDAYLKEVEDKIKELHPDISDEDLNKIIIMTGDQYSREEDFHGDSITSSDFVDAAVEIYQTDILSTRSDDEDGKYFHPDSPFRKDGVFGGWSQAQYDAYQENPRKYEKYLMRGGGWEITENKLLKLTPQEQDIFNDITSSLNEGMFDDVLEKVKKYARKGLMTVALLSSLMAPSLGFSQVQKQQINNVARTEMTAQAKSENKSENSFWFAWEDAFRKYQNGETENLSRSLKNSFDDYIRYEKSGMWVGGTPELHSKAMDKEINWKKSQGKKYLQDIIEYAPQVQTDYQFTVNPF